MDISYNPKQMKSDKRNPGSVIYSSNSVGEKPSSISENQLNEILSPNLQQIFGNMTLYRRGKFSANRSNTTVLPFIEVQSDGTESESSTIEREAKNKGSKSSNYRPLLDAIIDQSIGEKSDIRSMPKIPQIPQDNKERSHRSKTQERRPEREKKQLDIFDTKDLLRTLSSQTIKSPRSKIKSPSKKVVQSSSSSTLLRPRKTEDLGINWTTMDLQFENVFSDSQLWKEFYNYLESECREQLLLFYKDAMEIKTGKNFENFKQDLFKIDNKYLHIRQGKGSFIFESHHRQTIKELFDNDKFSESMLDMLCNDVLMDLKSLFVDFVDERNGQGMKL